ncbi:MAG: flavin reductase [Culturomica sp.]|nr:flavin reductase [Culturomica sp.]
MVTFGCKCKDNAGEQKSSGELKKIDVFDFQEKIVKLIAKDWMLITAGTPDKFNTMTASWGCLGNLWNKPVAIVFVRPQRYTFEFTEANDRMTLSFFPDNYRPQLTLLGTKSGRDTDKVKESGLTPIQTPYGNMTFKEARIVVEGKKLYADFFEPESFIDKSIDTSIYPTKDYHKMYIIEIENIYIK